MSGVIYITKQPAIKPFFDHIQSAGVPNKVTLSYLETVGFKSTNDRPLVTILKALGFLDDSGVPTDRWAAYQDKSRAGAVMAEAIREAYSGLFQIYPDAQRKDNEAVHNYFASQSDLSEGTIGHAVRTFKTLCGLADWDADPKAVAEAAEGTRTTPLPTSLAKSAGDGKVAVTSNLMSVPAININLQLELPATDDSSVYDALFKSMREHLIDVDSTDA